MFHYNPFFSYAKSVDFREIEIVVSYRWLHIYLTGSIKVLVVIGAVKYGRFYTSISISDRMNENR